MTNPLTTRSRAFRWSAVALVAAIVADLAETLVDPANSDDSTKLFDAASRQVPAIPDGIARGEFAPLFAWLREQVHGRGSFLSTDDLVADATGRPLDAAVYQRHLERRYLDR